MFSKRNLDKSYLFKLNRVYTIRMVLHRKFLYFIFVLMLTFALMREKEYLQSLVESYF